MEVIKLMHYRTLPEQQWRIGCAGIALTDEVDPIEPIWYEFKIMVIAEFSAGWVELQIG